MGPEELRRQAALEDRHFWYSARRRQVARRIPPSRSAQRALDLGAGSGGNTGLLTAAGYQTFALERHPLAVATTRDRGFTAVQGDAQSLPFQDNAFDLVLACDVLEHLPDDAAAAREIRRVLRPGGRLVATVPADPDLWSDHDVALDHYRRYTRSTLSSLLDGNGLTAEPFSSWMVLLRPLVAVRRRLRAGSAPAGGPASDLDEVSLPLNALLGLVLRLEHHVRLLGRLRGVSLIAVASRVDD